jgi:C4-dicarboxylate-specific signal transduction histidine kinase
VIVKSYDARSKVECIPAQIKQVFLNLLINAAHAKGESGTLTVATAEQDHEVCVMMDGHGRGDCR